MPVNSDLHCTNRTAAQNALLVDSNLEIRGQQQPGACPINRKPHASNAPIPKHVRA
jgi:hypothetical protein